MQHLSRRRARPRVLAVLAVLVAALAVQGVALAAPKPGAYKGQTDQSRPVTFNVQDGKVKNFVGGITLYCVLEGRFQFDAVVAPKALRIKGNGHFDFVGRDKTKTGEIKIHGRFVSRRKAKGTLEMGTGGCSGEAKFNATKQGS